MVHLGRWCTAPCISRVANYNSLLLILVIVVLMVFKP